MQALTNGILNNIEKGYSWATFVKEVRRSLKSSKLTQIPQFEVGRLQDANQPAFQRLLPNGVEPVSVQLVTMPYLGILTFDHGSQTLSCLTHRCPRRRIFPQWTP